jgi:hypothetical protein
VILLLDLLRGNEFEFGDGDGFASEAGLVDEEFSSQQDGVAGYFSGWYVEIAAD